MKILSALIRFLGPVANAIRGYVNWGELLRIVVTSLVAGGSAFGTLEAVQANLAEVWADPSTLAAATAGITFVVELIRRSQQGPPLEVVAAQVVAKANGIHAVEIQGKRYVPDPSQPS